MSILAKLNDVSVGKKLGAGFAVLVLLTAAVAIIAINTLNAYNERSLIVAAASSAESYLLDARTDEKNFQLRRETRYLEAAEQLADKAAETVLPLKDVLVVPADHERVEFIIENVRIYKSQLEALSRALDGRPDGILAAEEELRKTARAMVDKAVELQEVQVERMEEQFSSAVALLITVTVIALIVAVGIAWFMIRSITGPIRQTVEVANEVASGNLTVEVKADRSDEFGTLLAAFSTMVTKLRDLIQQIDTGASNIASSSEELSAVTDQTRQGVAEQRDQTDQVATAMNEMVATVNDVAKSAEAAFEAAQRASQKSSEGQSAVNQTLEYVTDLNTKNGEVMAKLRGLQSDTQNIVTVLDVIKSVAEQTNLLALNAAIEAARAGEQGRGFAVVADEVRSLAQRTQTSAQEIETLINNLVSSAESSVNNMEAGTKLAEQTLEKAEMAGSTIREMAEAVEEIRQYNSQIATAAEQQSSVAEDINQNITLIRDVGEQSATSTEQVSAASEELAKLAEGLSTQVGQFRV
ncbi:methyl-accepting chemotaxis protein [Marinobacter sp. SS5-14b]|uniref:methyl-accepting chemotaxis protein n=1 Tax=Marinobacter sp. SS5-14b TaxID=3050456 RepID=UPI0026DF4686|nr:methyl-accepting chemotaxis protein [Marinobacter sp. SS5-14b]